LLGFQAYAANFGVSWLPKQIILARGYQGSLRWDWQLFSQDYFGILGAPRGVNWKQDEILDRVAAEAKVRNSGMTIALVPDLPRFNTSNFLLVAKEKKLPMHFDQLKSASNGLAAFDGFDFAVATASEQGMPWTTHAAGSLNQVIADNREIFKSI